MSIQNLIDQAKSKGLLVYAPVNLTSYFYVTNENDIGYCQFNSIDGATFSTVHKPCRHNGTGFRVDNIDEVFMYKPLWANGEVIKYKSFSDFQVKYWDKLVQY